MPTPIPATDAQLRQLAERGAQTWGDNVLGDFDRRWRTEQAADTLLSDVPADRRDAVADQFAQFLEQRHDRLVTVVDRHRGPIADQAWAVLAARNPRLTDHDLHDVAAADQLAAWAVAATSAHQESAAKIEGIGESIKVFPELVGPRAGMQATLEARFDHLREELAERIARTSRIRALIDTHPERDALLAAIGADLWAAQAAAADQLADLAGSESDLHRALHSMFDGTAVDEQMAEEIMAVFNAHLPAVAETSATLGAHLETLAESATGYFCNPVVQP